MGVWKRQSGKWSYEFKHKGRKIGRYDFRTKAEAQAAEARERERLKKGATLITFLEAATKRLDYLSAFCTPAHFRDNRAILRRFMAWHDLFIEDITPEMIRTRLIEFAQELGSHNVNRHLVALKAVFNLAVKDGQLPRNPCNGIPRFPTEKAVKSIPPKDHIAQVLLLAKPLDRAYLNVIRFTAARVREINNLTWEDVDWDRRQIRLWTRKKRGGHKTPRLVPMVQDVHASLRYAWENRDRTSPYVFTNPLTKKKYDYRDKFLGTLCRRAGVPGFGYHALRHHTASILAERGAPITDIQKILGHERPTTTDNYLQSLGESVRAAMGLLEEGATESATDDFQESGNPL
jgi:integrase